MKLYQLLTEAKRTFDVSTTFESVVELLTCAGIHKNRLEDLKCRLQELVPAISGQGAVYARDWMKLKEALNHVFNEAFEKVYYEPAITENENDEWYFTTSPYFYLSKEIQPVLSDSTISKNIKQLNITLQKAEDADVPEPVKHKLKKLKCIAEAYMELIEAQRAASNKIIVKKHYRAMSEIAQNTQNDSNFVLIKQSLKQIISKPLDKLEKELQEEYQDRIARLKSKIKRLDGKILAPGHGEQGDLSAEQLQLFIKLFNYDILDAYSGRKVQSTFVNVKPVDGIKFYAADKAKSERDEIESAFIAKNANKLMAIVANKNEPPSIQHEGEPKITAGLIHATLKFIFADGAKFTVINKVVINRSQKGDAFYQYPVTFHDVTLSDGTRISSPSEDKMLNQFR